MKLISKSELMQAVIVGGQHECFEHSEFGIFDVTAIREWAKANLEPVTVYLSDIVPFIRTSRVVDPERVDELSDESWQEDPGIAIVVNSTQNDVQHVLIDGSHRALRREAEGLDEMLFYMVPVANAVRPRAGWIKNPFVDWGDEIINGKIVKRSEP